MVNLCLDYGDSVSQFWCQEMKQVSKCRALLPSPALSQHSFPSHVLKLPKQLWHLLLPDTQSLLQLFIAACREHSLLPGVKCSRLAVLWEMGPHTWALGIAHCHTTQGAEICPEELLPKQANCEMGMILPPIYGKDKQMNVFNVHRSTGHRQHLPPGARSSCIWKTKSRSFLCFSPWKYPEQCSWLQCPAGPFSVTQCSRMWLSSEKQYYFSLIILISITLNWATLQMRTQEHFWSPVICL